MTGIRTWAIVNSSLLPAQQRVSPGIVSMDCVDQVQFVACFLWNDRAESSDEFREFFLLRRCFFGHASGN